MLTIHTTIVDGLAVCKCSGRITLGEGSVELENTIKRLIKDGQVWFVIDLSDVDYSDSSGMGALATVYAWARNAGGSLVASNLTRKINDLFQITKWYKFIQVFPTVTEAAAYLQNSRTASLQKNETKTPTT